MKQINKKHPLFNYPEEDRVAYLSMVATILYVDNQLKDEEVELLDNLISEFKISPSGKEQIYSYLKPINEEANQELIEIINDICNTNTSCRLIEDLGLAATIDREFLPEEYQYIFNVAKKLTSINK